MMDISNKEIIEKLIAYYKKQDVDIIYRVLANCMIDFNRLDTIDKLPIEEKTMLQLRIKLNAQELRKFVKEGDKGKPITLTNVGNV